MTADRRYEFAQRLQARRSRGGGRRDGAGGGTCAGFCRRPGSRSARSTSARASARRRSRRSARRASTIARIATAPAAADAARRRADGGDAGGLCAHAVRSVCAASSTARCSRRSNYRGPRVLRDAVREVAARRKRARRSSGAPSISAAAPALPPRAFAKQVDHDRRLRPVARHDRAGARRPASTTGWRWPTWSQGLRGEADAAPT